jgi:hypothetical protein
LHRCAGGVQKVVDEAYSLVRDEYPYSRGKRKSTEVWTCDDGLPTLPLSPIQATTIHHIGDPDTEEAALCMPSRRSYL